MIVAGFFCFFREKRKVQRFWFCSREAGDLDVEGGKRIHFDGLQLPGLHHAVRQRVDPLQEQGVEKRGSAGDRSVVVEAQAAQTAQ